MIVRRILAVTALLLLVAALLLSFEFGRNQAGFSVFDQRRERESLETELAAREVEIEVLERELAIVRTSSQIDSESTATVQAGLAELEARLQAQEEELAFYRGIVSPGDGVAGLRIQSVEIEPSPTGDGLLLQVLLVQAIVNNDPVTGELRANLRGNLNGQAAAYTLADLSARNESGALQFEFRYFQALAVELVLPEEFEPAELELEVWPQSPQGETIVQSFPWNSFQG
jgi:hypothetical protein